MRRLRWVVVVVGILLIASAIAGVAEPRFVRAADTPATKSIVVTGTGVAETVPDRATFSFGVDSRGATAKEALAKNAAATSALIAALKQAGVTDSNLQTTGVWLSLRQASDGSITGYEAANSLTATTAMAKAGPLVDTAVAAGATNVYGPNMLNSDQDALYRQALKSAVADAAAKAAALAAASGLSLGSARTVSEGVQGTPYYPGPAAATGATSSGSTSTPIAPGTRSVHATVTVNYEAS